MNADRIVARVYDNATATRVMNRLFRSGMPFAVDYRIPDTGETGFSAPIAARANFEAVIATSGPKAGSAYVQSPR